MYVWRGLFIDRNLFFWSDWVSFIVGDKFIIFVFFYFVFEGSFLSISFKGVYMYIWRGVLMDVFFFCIIILGGLYMYLVGFILYIEGLYGIFGIVW